MAVGKVGGGVKTWTVKPGYQTYRSPYGPKYKVPFNLAGIDRQMLMRYSIIGGSFASVAGLFAIFFLSDVPRIRKDIMQKIPIIGGQFVREVPPSDNPF